MAEGDPVAGPSATPAESPRLSLPAAGIPGSPGAPEDHSGPAEDKGRPRPVPGADAVDADACEATKARGSPLRRLMTAMIDITYGRYDRPVHGTAVRDEIGDMARAVEGFRDNAIAKRKAEDALRAAKDRAE